MHRRNALGDKRLDSEGVCVYRIVGRTREETGLRLIVRLLCFTPLLNIHLLELDESVSISNIYIARSLGAGRLHFTRNVDWYSNKMFLKRCL